ncbi:MAG: YgiQ family radical SAM protein [Candidatus Brocadiae bacterium]|nr:YgiQ family radical SAM protein [Candidatus Brocadiia bacterium]
MSKEEASAKGYQKFDIILVTGDAYIDHPSFGVAVIGRSLEHAGFHVGIIAQPEWKNAEAFRKLGKPRLFFGVTAGNMDSMVSHYTPSQKKRHNDSYTPGGASGLRPDMATIVYANRCKEAFPDVPIVLGGIEASLRRFSHYDYWKDKVKPSILLDSKADILVYGNGEKQAIEIARRLSLGENIKNIQDIPGTVVKVKNVPAQAIMLPSHLHVSEDKAKYSEMFRILTFSNDNMVAQPVEHWYILQNQRCVYTQQDLDLVYSLPYQRIPHFSYIQPIPALATVRHSVQTHRGCFGGCSFCAIYFHEGKRVISRSEETILQEIQSITQCKGFGGTIDNVGGPTANMYGMDCKIGWCSSRPSCLFPQICKNLIITHKAWLELLQKIRSMGSVKNVFVESGIRHDLFLADKPQYLEEFCKHYISGQLKTAPEHCSNRVLHYMRKPPYSLHKEFQKRYAEIAKKIGKKQYLVPYFMSSHPGCDTQDMISLAQEIKSLGHFVEQVQDFTPTPMTLASCMYYTGHDPLTKEEVPVARTLQQKKCQRAFLQSQDPKNYDILCKALNDASRQDLIGKGPKCLIPEKKPGTGSPHAFSKKRKR